MNRLLTFIFAVAILLIAEVSACTPERRLLHEFDKDEFVFIGEVVGFTEPLVFNEEVAKLSSYQTKHAKAVGIMVKLGEAVNVPSSPLQHFEVFQFLSAGNCEPTGMSLAQVEKTYPIGSNIVVISKKASILPYILPNGNLRLEGTVTNGTLLFQNPASTDTLHVSAATWRNYSDFRLPARRESKHFYAIAFEVRKELLRLRNATAINEKNDIIRRLLNVPAGSEFVDYYSLLLRHTKNRVEAEALFVKKLLDDGWTEDRIQKYLVELRKQHTVKRMVSRKV